MGGRHRQTQMDTMTYRLDRPSGLGVNLVKMPKNPQKLRNCGKQRKQRRQKKRKKKIKTHRGTKKEKNMYSDILKVDLFVPSKLYF